MSAEKTVTIYCDGPGCAARLTLNAQTYRDARVRARGAGWLGMLKHSSNGPDYCPACVTVGLP